MKGLFVKDIELMKQQKQYFILVIVMGVILNLAGSGSVRSRTSGPSPTSGKCSWLK